MERGSTSANTSASRSVPCHRHPRLAGDTESASKNMAQAYFAEFTSTFAPLGVEAEFYYMSDIYRAGRLDDTIDLFLRRASAVRGDLSA